MSHLLFQGKVVMVHVQYYCLIRCMVNFQLFFSFLSTPSLLFVIFSFLFHLDRSDLHTIVVRLSPCFVSLFICILGAVTLVVCVFVCVFVSLFVLFVCFTIKNKKAHVFWTHLKMGVYFMISVRRAAAYHLLETVA